jgi:hypothetical protein
MSAGEACRAALRETVQIKKNKFENEDASIKRDNEAL